MYTYAPDGIFIEAHVKNNPILRYLRKVHTLLDEKEKFKIDFVEFFFCDPDFYDGLLDDFGALSDKENSFYHNLATSTLRNPVIYRPVYDVSSFSRKNFYERCFRAEERLLNLSKIDSKYFGNIVNFTFFNQMEWPKIQRTRITLDHLLDLFNAWDRTQMLEEVPFLPSSKAFTGEEVNPKYIELYVYNYFSSVIKKSADVDEYGLMYNDVGFYTEHRKLIDSVALITVVPGLLLGGMIVDSFYSH